MDEMSEKLSGIDSYCFSQQEIVEEKSKKVSINSFTLLCVIGKGSYAKVVLVQKKDNNKVYAMKMLKKSYIQKRKQITHILAERNILCECDHPFIVKLAYAFQSDKKLYFCLEYCPGGELYNLLCQRTRLTEEQLSAEFLIKYIKGKILCGLDRACLRIPPCLKYHLQGVIPFYYLTILLSLKPENVLIGSDGYIKLTDFGLSKQGIEGNDGAHSRCGTPEYLAPEVLQGSHGKAVDWWTLGALLYEMVSGFPPFQADNREKLFDMIKKSEVNLSRSFSPALKDLLSELFRKNPSDRLGSKGVQEVKQRKWFASVDWDRIMQKEVPPFFNPHLDDEADVKYFDINFVSEPINSYTSSNPASSNQIYEEGFSFNQMSPASNHSLTGDIPGDIPRDKDSNFMMNIEETSDNNPN